MEEGGRYNLRPHVAEPDRYVLGAMNVGNREVRLDDNVDTGTKLGQGASEDVS